MNKLRIAFAGFRHGHIVEVHQFARQRPDMEITAVCEDDPATRQEITRGGIAVTHDNYEAFWREAQFDILAVGDYYGRRGSLLIRALENGKHVIADKPICTSLAELDRVAELSRRGGLSVGCQLSMRGDGNFLALRQLVASGAIGTVHTIDFNGQHPLFRDRRPGWYFEPGKHGGTINDLAIHAVDAIAWLTGRRISAVTAARVWNARTQPAFFQDGAQMMFRLDNNGGAIGDVSYLTPDSFAYKVPCYWRFTLHGESGLAETSCTAEGVVAYINGENQPRKIAKAAARPGGYLEDFLEEVRGGLSAFDQSPLPVLSEAPPRLTTAQVLHSSRLALLAQKAADENLRDLAIT